MRGSPQISTAMLAIPCLTLALTSTAAALDRSGADSQGRSEPGAVELLGCYTDDANRGSRCRICFTELGLRPSVYSRTHAVFEGSIAPRRVRGRGRGMRLPI